jgi:PhnB protein
MANSLIEQLDKFVDTVIAGQETRVSGVEQAIAPLAEIAVELRVLPRQNFRERLKVDLQRSAIQMSATATTAKVKPIREGFHTVTPYITVSDALGVIDFVKAAFDAEGKIYGIGSQGGIHSEFKVGDSILMIGGGGTWKGASRPTALHYYVDDVDAVYERALKAGGVSMMKPIEDHGERVASVKDIGGNEWYIAKRLTGSHTDEGLRSVTPYLHPQGALSLIGFLKEAFAAEEIAVYKSPDSIVQHAKLRIGDSVVEMGEAHGQWQPMPTTFFLYVEDVDAWYARAVQAGAISKGEPADQPYGDRVAAVADSHDNLWYIATHIADVV